MSEKFIVSLRGKDDIAAVEQTGAEVLVTYPDNVLVRANESQQAALAEAGLELAAVPAPEVQVSGFRFDFDSVKAANDLQPIEQEANRVGYYLVQLVGPPNDAMLEAIRGYGATIHANLSNFTLLVGLLPGKVAALSAEPFVEEVSPYRPAMKVSNHLRADNRTMLETAELANLDLDGGAGEEKQQVRVTVFPGESAREVAAQVREAGGLVLSESESGVTAIVAPAEITRLAEMQAVQAIVPHSFAKLFNDRARAVMAVPNDHVFDHLTVTGGSQIVAVADSGLDTGNAATVHVDFAGRVAAINSMPVAAYLNDLITDPPGTDNGPADLISGHGTHVAGSVLGSGAAAVAAGSATVPRGAAPEARLFFQAIEQTVNWKTVAQLIADGIVPPGTVIPDWPPPASSLWGIPENLADLFDPAYAAGARIHTNSWGADEAGVYTENAREVDDYLFNHRDFLVIFSAGNEGLDNNSDGVIDADSMGSPGTAKNCLTVGATENNRPAGSVPTPGIDGNWNALGSGGGPTWPALGPAGHVSDDIEGMAAFSSRGPTDDGRIKPDVVAPGTNVLSTRSSVATGDLWGDVTPAGDPLNGIYVWSGGTSMATPLVAGAAALIRQHLVEQRGHVQAGVKPSGALIKAFLINGATAIAGNFPGEVPAGPNSVSGFGRVNLAESLTPGALRQTLFADEPEYAVKTLQTRTFHVIAIDPAQPLKATLVWTDAAGPVNAGGLENELYLQVVTPGGAVLNGDVTPFPTASNNVQQVVINAPAAGTYEIRVRGVSVTTQAPGASAVDGPRQDFALVVSNAMGFSTQPVSIAQAIDTTGSMGTFGYMEPAKERARQLLDFMRINDKAAVVEFSQRPGVPSDARTVYPLRLLGAFTPDWSDAHTAIAALHADGRTPIGAGLQEAWNQLAAEPTSRPRAIVLLSDGFNNEPPDPAAVLPGIPSDVPIFTIALGPASLAATLSTIAGSRPNGAYYTVESDEDIHRLHAIYAQVQALAAGAALIGLSSAELDNDETASEEMHVDPDAREATFTLTWEEDAGGEEMELIAVAPDGTEFSEANPSAAVRRGASYAIMRVGAPQPGPWKVAAINRGSQRPLRVTLSGAVQSGLHLSAETVKVGREFLVLSALLQRFRQPFDDARVFARITLPGRSLSELLQEFGNEIRDIDLPDALQERGLSEEQLLRLKLALFAQKFREEEGGLFGRHTIEVPLLPQGDGRFSNEIPLSATGNAQIEVVARGEIDGVTWERRATRALHIPEKVEERRDVAIKEIFARRNRLWPYTIIGVSVVDASGDAIAPEEGIAVELDLALGNQHVRSGELPYYRRGQYYIWRFRTPPFSINGRTALVTATATRDGMVVASARERLRF